MKQVILLSGSIALSMLVAPPVQAAECGAEGERACCWALPFVWETTRSGHWGPCEPGLEEVGGVGFCKKEKGSGNCGPADCSAGICAKPTDCGGVDERACCWALPFVWETTTDTGEWQACNDGLQEVGGEGFCEDQKHEDGEYGECGVLDCSIGICSEPTPCGGLYERACCWAMPLVWERTTDTGKLQACEDGLHEVLELCEDYFPEEGQCGVLDCSIGICVPCGGHEEWPCDLLFCNSGHTLDIDPSSGTFGKCIECGGEGQIQCLNIDKGDYGCKDDHTTNPNYPTHCMSCDQDRLAEEMVEVKEFWGGCENAPFERQDAYGACVEWPQIEEPDCNLVEFVPIYDNDGNLIRIEEVELSGVDDCLAKPQPKGVIEGDPLYGVADTHAHPFSNLAFGGGLLWGSVFDVRGINAALAWGDYTWDFWTVSDLGFDVPTIPTSTGYRIHEAPMAELMAVLNGEGIDHSPKGPPGFENWPNWDTTMHQQQYYRWLQRAYKGGLRLMVMQAVNNEISCRLSMSTRACFGCDDMDTVDRQLLATRQLETFVDLEDDLLENDSGWFKVVETPDEAEDAIRAGKMAVVLGIEVDALFGCKNPGDCTDQHVRDQLQHYYDLGVRHVFPMHLHDNAFGGTAIYHWLWPIANVVMIGKTMDLGDYCENLPLNSEKKFNYNPSVFNESGDPTGGLPDFIKAAAEFLIVTVLGIDWDSLTVFEGAQCNTRGLQPLGHTLLDEMMNLNMIIDTDHMSLPTFEDVMAKAEARLYPVISGHTFLFDKPIAEFGNEGFRTENHRTLDQIKRIRDLGGIVAPVPPRKEGSSTHDYAEMYNYLLFNLTHDCEGSDCVEIEGLYGKDNPGLAFGSDWGAMFFQVAPRCPDYVYDPDVLPVPEDCREVRGEREPPLQYPFTITGMPSEADYGFRRQKTGDKVFDFNLHGMAHIGLFPDFLADLNRVGVTERELKPLFRSAETYIKMWRRIENEDRDDDGINALIDNCPYVWNPGQEDCDDDGLGNACDPGCSFPPDCSGATIAEQAADASCLAVISSADVTGVTDPEGDTLDIDVSPTMLVLGSNTVTVSANDGNGGTCEIDITVNVVDQMPPEITTCPGDIEVEPTGPDGATGTYMAPVGTDNCPGATTVQTEGLGPDATFPIGTTSETYTVTDGAGNEASCTFTVTVLSPRQVAEKLIGWIEDLVSAGTLTQEQGDGLIDKLQKIIIKLEPEPRLKPACNQIGAFINQVEAFVNEGYLTALEGQTLIDSAVNVGKGAGCTGDPF